MQQVDLLLARYKGLENAFLKALCRQYGLPGFFDNINISTPPSSSPTYSQTSTGGSSGRKRTSIVASKLSNADKHENTECMSISANLFDKGNVVSRRKIVRSFSFSHFDKKYHDPMLFLDDEIALTKRYKSIQKGAIKPLSTNRKQSRASINYYEDSAACIKLVDSAKRSSVRQSITHVADRSSLLSSDAPTGKAVKRGRARRQTAIANNYHNVITTGPTPPHLIMWNSTVTMTENESCTDAGVEIQRAGNNKWTNHIDPEVKASIKHILSWNP